MTRCVNLNSFGFPWYSVDELGVFYTHIKNEYDIVAKRYSGKLGDLEYSQPLALRGGGTQQLTIRMVDESGVRRQKRAAEIVANVFVDNPNNYTRLRYLDGNVNNIAYGNLQWVQAENYYDVGYSFITKNGASGIVIGSDDGNKLRVKLTSDRAIECKSIVLIASFKSVKNHTLEHPYLPSVHGVGCLGYGPHRVSHLKNGVELKNPIYNRWSAMLYRCYIDRENTAYFGTKVSEVFLDFQKYADFVCNEMTKCGVSSLTGFELDKDYLSDFGEGYTPQTLTIVPSFINGFAAVGTKSAGPLPPGISYSPVRKEIKATITKDGKQQLVKSFRVNHSSAQNVANINTLITLYLTEKAIVARTRLLECQERLPSFLLNPIVANVLANFAEHLARKDYPNAGWEIVKVADEWKLTDLSIERALAALR